MEKMKITLNIKIAMSLWGRSALPMGSIACGAVDDQALIWLPTGWWAGTIGSLSSLDQKKVQRAWLQQLRTEHDKEALMAAVEVSWRTWQNWELGRIIPAPKLYKIYHNFLQNA